MECEFVLPAQEQSTKIPATRHSARQQHHQQLLDQIEAQDAIQAQMQSMSLAGPSERCLQAYGSRAPLPIDDFHLLENPNKYGEEEKQLRIKLTAVYRLIELNGWSMGIYNHATAKLEKQHERFLIHPFGLHYDEITASSLLKIDMSGNIVDQGSTNFELNRPGYIIHSAIHMARPDIKAVIHLHYPPVSAVSTCRYGLLPVCQERALLGEIAYLDYEGILTQEHEREAVAEGLGKTCKVMILRNHGLIVCGETIEEAFYLLTNLMRACETQARVLALGGGLENLILMSDESAQQAWQMVQSSRYPIKQVVSESHLSSLLAGAGEPGVDAAAAAAAAAAADTNTAPQATGGVAAVAAANTNQVVANESLALAQLLKDHKQQQQQQQQQLMLPSQQKHASSESTTSGNESDSDHAENERRTRYQQLQARRTSLRKHIVGYVNMFELDFEAQMRSLDAAGHRTGYKYRRPLVRYYRRS